LDYLVLFDLEANTPTEYNSLKFNEVLELPAVVLDLKNNSLIGEFQTYVRPTIDDRIPPFCTYLTGIDKKKAYYKSENVKNPTFGEALN